MLKFTSTNPFYHNNFSCFSCSSSFTQIPYVKDLHIDENKLKEIEAKIKELNNYKEPDVIIKSDNSTKVVNVNWSSLGPSWS